MLNVAIPFEGDLFAVVMRDSTTEFIFYGNPTSRDGSITKNRHRDWELTYRSEETIESFDLDTTKIDDGVNEILFVVRPLIDIIGHSCDTIINGAEHYRTYEEMRVCSCYDLFKVTRNLHGWKKNTATKVYESMKSFLQTHGLYERK
jgi:hypothetical protein